MAAPGRPAYAQPVVDSTHVPEFGVMVQASAQAEAEPALYTNGFGVDRARLAVSGSPIAGISYELEGDFVDEEILTDAHVDVQMHAYWRLRAGQFRPPLSYGEIVSSSATPFVLRARPVRALGASRKPGALVTYQRADWRVDAGTFNGTRIGTARTEPDAARRTAEDQLMYLGRVAWLPQWATGRAALGASVAHDPAGDALQHGPRTRYSANAHVQQGAVGLTIEGLAGTAAAPGEMEAGAYVTGTYQIASVHTARLRTDWARYKDSVGGPVAEAATQVGVGYTYQPASYLRLEADATVPVDGRDVQPVVVRTQLQVHF